MNIEQRIYYIKGMVDNELKNAKNYICVDFLKYDENNKRNPQDIKLGHSLVDIQVQLEEIIKEIEK